MRIIKFEASSSEDRSHPIGVALAVWPARGYPISVWSPLIRPAEDRRRFGHWSLASRKVHGIAMSALEGDLPAPDAAVFLNDAAGAGVVWCDGAYPHRPRALFRAGGLNSCVEPIGGSGFFGASFCFMLLRLG